MVERVDVGVVYRAQPVTEVPVAEMPETAFGSPVTNLGKVISAAIRVNGFKYTSACGFGGFIGLEEHLDAKLGPILPECDKGFCGIEATLDGTSTGIADTCRLTIKCSRLEGPDEETIEAAEAQCFDNHAQAQEAVVRWLWETVSKVETANQDKAAAQKRIGEAESLLRDLV